MAIRAGKVTFAGDNKKIKAGGGASKSILILADKTNANNLWIGGKEETEEPGNAFPLAPGLSLGVDATDSGLIYVYGVENDIAYFFLDGNLK